MPMMFPPPDARAMSYGMLRVYPDVEIMVAESDVEALKLEGWRPVVSVSTRAPRKSAARAAPEAATTPDPPDLNDEVPDA